MNVVPVFWKTETHRTSIKRVQPAAAGPVFLRFKHGDGLRLERRRTMFHKYHETFDDAREFLLEEIASKLESLNNHLELLGKERDRLKMLKEPTNEPAGS